MANSVFHGQAEIWLRGSADILEGYIASEETIQRFCEMFIRLKQSSRPSKDKVGGYKAFVLAQSAS